MQSLAGNASTLHSITVDRCHFEDNLYGIRLSYSDNAQLTRNRFYTTTGAHPDVYSEDGVYLDYCTDFRVEENEFTNTSSSIIAFGTTVRNSGDLDNQVYKNKYSNMQLATTSLGYNRLYGAPWMNGQSGLEFFCNDNFNNNYDFYIVGGVDGVGVKRSNGVGTGSGNTFTQNWETGEDYTNTSLYNVDYYWGTNDGMYPTRKPMEFEGAFTPFQYTTTHHECKSQFPDHPIGSGGIMNSQKVMFYQSTMQQSGQQLQNELNSLGQLIDGGNTNNLLQQIASVTPNTVGQLYNLLQSKSPYLSQSVLEAMSSISPSIFQNGLKKNLIMANIEVAYNLDFMDYLQNIANLPSSTISSIQGAIDNGVKTQRSTNYRKIEEFARDEAFAASMLMQHYKNDTLNFNLSTIRTVINDRNDPLSQLRLIDSYLHENELVTAYNLNAALQQGVGNYPQHLQDDVQTYVDVKQTIKTALEQPGLIAQLDSTTLSQLRSLANNGSGIAKAQAQNILCYFYDECPAPESISLPQKSMLQNQVSQLGTDSEKEFELRPNPANDFVELSWAKETDVHITITDLSGKVILNTSQSGSAFTWNTDSVKQGIYFVSVLQGAESLGTEKVMIMH